MTTTKTVGVADVLAQMGRCLELVPLDPHCQGISVSLYEKEGILTVWSFSQKEGVQLRLRQIRDRLVAMGGLSPVPRTTNKANFPCGYLHLRPLKFLTMQAVEKPLDYVIEAGTAVKDFKSDLMLRLVAHRRDNQWVYQVTAEGEAPNRDARIRAIVGGLVRYGEMAKVSDTEVAFACGERHDKLAQLLLPYARNVTGVEDMLESSALRGQMTTGTLGFTPN